VARIEEKINASRLSVQKPERKRWLWRPKNRWEDNIKMDLKYIGLDGVYGTHIAQDRDKRRAVAETIMIIRVWWIEVNLLTPWGTVSTKLKDLTQSSQEFLSHYCPEEEYINEHTEIGL
jgi:hypothetical protein